MEFGTNSTRTALEKVLNIVIFVEFPMLVWQTSVTDVSLGFRAAWPLHAGVLKYGKKFVRISCIKKIAVA